MSAESKNFRLGLFVLGAAILTAGATIVLGVGALFRTKAFVETTIDESVIGLDEGSPVRYRGVLVGQVHSIGFVNTVYQVDDNRVRVVVAMFPEKVKMAASAGGFPEELISKLSRDGLRIRLASQGLTGGLYLEVDYVDPKDNPVPHIAWVPEFPHIPSVKSTGARLIEEAGGILKSLGKVPFEDMGHKLTSALDSLDKLLKKMDPSVESLADVAGETSGLVKDLRKTFNESISKEFTGVMQELKRILQDDLAPAVKAARGSADRLPATLERLDAALDRATSALKKTDRLLAEREGSLEEALDNVRVLTQDLREVSGTLKRYPASAIFGEAPPRPKSEAK